MYAFSWLPPSHLTSFEAFWLHPLPLRARVHATATAPADWSLVDVTFCGRSYRSAAALRAAHEAGAQPLCLYRNATGDLPWEVPQKTKSTHFDERRPP